MSKCLKKYNEEKQCWEIISQPVFDIVQQIGPDEGPIIDGNVIVTSPYYSDAEEESGCTLDNALTTIGDDISELKRNVSWLAEHGGGGGGGGGGTTTGYGIVINEPIIEANAVYISDKNITIKFMITGGTFEEKCQYKYSLDGNESSPAICNPNSVVTINIPDINRYSTSTSHTFSINATNEFGTPIPPANFRIYENALKLSLNPTRNEISNNEVLLSISDKSGLVYFDMRNSLIGSTVAITYECNGEEFTMTAFENEKVESLIAINVWNVLKGTVVANQIYTVSIRGQAAFGNIINKTDKISFNVRFRNPDEMTIFFDGLSYKEDVISGITTPTEIEQSDLLKFSFKVSLPSIITNRNIYYAIKIVSKDGLTEQYIAGSSMSDTKDSVYKQTQGKARTNIVVQYPLSSFKVSNEWSVYVKAWTFDAERNCENIGMLNIIASNVSIFPRQHNKRLDSDDVSANTCLYAWSYSTPMYNNRWESSNDYKMLTTNETVIAKGYINPYNTNGTNSGFITKEEIPYLRLQNKAYAIADMSEYATELKALSNNIYNREGFTISVTFKCDEHIDNKKVIFFYGDNTADKELKFGMKITLESASWLILGETPGAIFQLTAFLRQNTKNTVDFVYDGTNAFIYVNGIINATAKVGPLYESEHVDEYKFGDKIYLGCDYFSDKDEVDYFSDVNIYEVAIYTKALKPLQIAINGKNARLNGQPSNKEVIDDYQEWKRKNLIYSLEQNPRRPYSYLIDPETGMFKYQDYNELRKRSPIPIIKIDATGTEFTSEYFHKDQSEYKESVLKERHKCTIEYFEPSIEKNVSFEALVSLQGTSTLGYYVKNLEILVNDNCSYDATKKKLFQPREDWFPENEFTLKADVVDSSHANNATIGYWINKESGLMENNPAQAAMTDEYRPKDRINYNGVIKEFVHKDSRPGKTEDINFDEKVTIKHNLEGFPVIVLIQFQNASDYELIGIYSFNLGRYSYYNMGLSFLKAFSRRDISENPGEVHCPALVDYYEEYARNEKFGAGNGVMPNEIFSYEFDASADDNNIEHQAWTQSDKTVLQYYGNFNFNGSNIGAEAPDYIWNKLSELFEITATMKVSPSELFGGKYKYEVITKVTPESTIYEFKRKENEAPYEVTTDNLADFNKYMSVKNAAAYFIIASAFGMIDSLGKNLTLRTWDGGKKWWTCFYDMDTALGLSNEGDENIDSNVFIDDYETITPENGLSYLQTYKHVNVGVGYKSYGSKLWAIFRDSEFLRVCGDARSYESIWTGLRSAGQPLDTYMNFIKLMEEHIASCGELLYDYDYYSKYIFASNNLKMLHGLRIEYVRNWLRKRFYFLDGVFEDKNVSSKFTDSPFYTNTFNVTAKGPENTSANYVSYTLNSTVPIFIKINVGTMENVPKYYIKPYTNTVIHTEPFTQQQVNFTSSSVLTVLDGLSGINIINMNTNNSDKLNVLPAVVNFDISGTKNLSKDDPIDFKKVFMSKDESSEETKYTGKSSLETVNLSNTKTIGEIGDTIKYNVDLNGFDKISSIDISNSFVNSLTLPSSVLQTFKFKNSNISILNLENQPALKELDFTGCNRLNSISLKNCDAITGLTIDNLSVLTSIVITDCYELTSITISNIKPLNKIQIVNCPKLKYVTISNIANTYLDVTIPVDALEELNLSDLETEKPINLTYTNVKNCENLKVLKVVNCYSLPGFKYNNEDLVYLKDKDKIEHPVFDVSKFINIDGVTSEFSGILSLYYLKVKSIQGSPFRLVNKTLRNSTNLIRVFGYISLYSQAVFASHTNFFINKPNDYLPKHYDMSQPGTAESMFVDNEYFTNVKVDTRNMASAFAETAITIRDVYYIMKQCKNVENLELAFSSITVKTTFEEPLSPYTFAYCEMVRNINSIFGDCIINGYLDDNLISNLDLITSFNNVFGVDSIYGISNKKCFFPERNIIAEIEEFNPIAIEEIDKTNEQAYNRLGDTCFNANILLSNLSEVTLIDSSFNECGINFTKSTTDKLFSKCKKLSILSDSFNEIIAELGDNKGKDSNGVPYINDTLGATNLRVISNSLSFSKLREAYVYIGDSLLNNIKDTIEYISNCYSYSEKKIIEGRTEVPFLFGGGIRKIIYKEDCEADEQGRFFPYKILENKNKLIECCGLLSNLEEDDEESTFVYDIPGRTFENSLKLKNVSNFFSDMKIKYQLTPNSFSNNRIERMAYIFKDRGNSKYGKQGIIPYRLFYQPNKIIKNLEFAMSYSLSYNLKPYACSDDVFNNYSATTVNGKIVLNDLIYDGSQEFNDNHITGHTIGDIYDLYTNYIDKGIEVPEEYQKYLDSDGNPLYEKVPELYKLVIEKGVLPDIPGEALRNDRDLIEEFSVRKNYFCPPDILSYCENSTLTSINSIFYANALDYRDRESGRLIGYRGRIPETIFKPVSNIRYIEKVFSGIPLLMPYISGTVKSDPITPEVKVYTAGYMYYPKLLSYFNNLISVNGLFEGNYIWGLSVLPEILFSSNDTLSTSLIYLSGLFESCKFVYINGFTQQQLPNNLFNTNSNIIDISRMLFKANGFVTNKTLFTSANNSRISDVSLFMKYAVLQEESTVPEFWNFGSVINFEQCYTQVKNISPSQTIPASYKQENNI